MPAVAERYRSPSQPFGRWLLDQQARADTIGQLAKAARSDPGFPSEGDFNSISARLNLVGADPEMHVALEDAELDWASI